MIKRIVHFALNQPLFIILGLVLFIGVGIAAFRTGLAKRDADGENEEAPDGEASPPRAKAAKVTAKAAPKTASKGKAKPAAKVKAKTTKTTTTKPTKRR